MPITITYSGGSLPTPSSVVYPSHDLSAGSGTIVHQLMNGATAYTLRQGSSSSATMQLTYTSLSTAKTAYQTLLLAAVFTYSNDNPTYSLKFVVTDTVELKQSIAGGSIWTITMSVREVT